MRREDAPHILSREKTAWVPNQAEADCHLRYMGSKPWNYGCEVTIPHLNTVDTLPTIIALLRLQTVTPFISIIDTGSTPSNLEKLEALRADDLEIHSFRFAGVRHSSDFPAIACDTAFSMCRSEKLVTMHSDVFLRRRDSLAQLLSMCSKETPAVGFQMTPRETPGWESVVGHAFAAFHMPTMDDIGAGWSLRRASRKIGCEHGPKSAIGNLLDTELCLSMILAEHGIKPHFIGTEANFEQTIHPLVRHVRTLTGARLYCPNHLEKSQSWLKDAMNEATMNIQNWSKQ